MGYACPVCEDPQSDATHLANHLAFTAMLRGGEHGEWLDDHVPEWGDLDETELGERVAEHAEETEFPQVFEDTTDRGPGSHGHDHGEGGHSHLGGGHTDPGDLPAGADALADEGLDEEAREAIAEAREMTRKRRENANAGSDGEGDGDTDGTDDGAGTETE
ncbi:MAG: DUF5810 domain-containing protein [Haloarculaceae archaeon]